MFASAEQVYLYSPASPWRQQTTYRNRSLQLVQTNFTAIQKHVSHYLRNRPMYFKQTCRTPRSTLCQIGHALATDVKLAMGIFGRKEG